MVEYFWGPRRLQIRAPFQSPVSSKGYLYVCQVQNEIGSNTWRWYERCHLMLSTISKMIYLEDKIAFGCVYSQVHKIFYKLIQYQFAVKWTSSEKAKRRKVSLNKIILLFSKTISHHILVNIFSPKSYKTVWILYLFGI